MSKLCHNQAITHHLRKAQNPSIPRESWIASDLGRIAATVDRVLAQANLDPDDIDRVFLTGGTSFVPAVQDIFIARFGPQHLSAGGEFVSVAEGLALIGRDRHCRNTPN